MAHDGILLELLAAVSLRYFFHCLPGFTSFFFDFSLKISRHMAYLNQDLSPGDEDDLVQIDQHVAPCACVAHAKMGSARVTRPGEKTCSFWSEGLGFQGFFVLPVSFHFGPLHAPRVHY